MVRRRERETLYMFILLLVLLPQPTVALNCQMACDHCYDDTEDPPLREVYCSMCEECLVAKRTNEQKEMKMRTEKIEMPPIWPKLNKPEKQGLRVQEYGWDNQEQGMYPECPTAAPCPEEEEEEEGMKEEQSKEEVVSEPTCPHPYMPPCLPLCPTPPRPTCPPIVPCKPKKLRATKKPPRPKPKRTYPPMTPWCWPYPYPAPAISDPDPEKVKETTIKDFVYVYVGVPKGVIANDTS